MKQAVLKQTRIHAGVWEGLLSGAVGVPQLEVLHLDQRLAGVTATAIAGEADLWSVHVPIPAQLLSDGVQTFVIQEVHTGQKLAHFSLIAGAAVGADLRAEMDLLRAELDLLKRAFRRHCVETAV